MYSNNSGSIRDALCFFLDEEQGHDIAFIQYPQNFENVVHNDIYGNPINTVNELDHPCLDAWGGMCYYGTGCFHRREALCGRIYSQDYQEDWTRVMRKTEGIVELEGMAKSLATCTYEHNTLWGIEKGVRYSCPLEDVITGLQIQCRGWRSVYYNPEKKGLLRHGPYLTGTDSGSAQEMDRRVSPDLTLKIQPLSIGSQEGQAGPSNGLLRLWVLGSEQLPHLILRHHPFTLLPQWHLPFPRDDQPLVCTICIHHYGCILMQLGGVIAMW